MRGHPLKIGGLGLQGKEIESAHASAGTPSAAAVATSQDDKESTKDKSASMQSEKKGSTTPAEGSADKDDPHKESMCHSTEFIEVYLNYCCAISRCYSIT